MTYFPRWVFDDSVKKYKGDFHTKNLNSYSHCLHLIFGQLAGCKSLKDIALVLRSVNKAAYHLGIPVVVDSSSLSKANESRDYRIFEELGMWLIRKVRPMYSKENVPDVYLSGWEIFAIDSTTIPCSIKLAEWTLGKYSKGESSPFILVVVSARKSICKKQIIFVSGQFRASNSTHSPVDVCFSCFPMLIY